MSRSVTSNQRGELKFSRTRRILRSAALIVVEGLEQRRLFANPVAAPGGPYTVDEGDSVLVSGLASTDDGSIVSHQWDTNYSAGRGFRPRFTGTKFNFVASDSGTKTIALRVTDNDGNATMATTTVTISDVAPTLTLNAPNNAAEGQNFDITWSYSDPGQSDAVTAWSVDWGDGSTTTVAGNVSTASHAYSEDGAYVVELTATQADATTSVTHNITIDNEAPQVTATSPLTSVDEGDTVTLNFASPNRASTVENWVIDWKDGNIDVLPAGTSSYTHQYTDSGTFAVTISALEPDGGEGSATVNFAVANVDPGVTITGVPATGDEGQAINVGSTVSDAGADDTHTYGWTVYRGGQHFVLPGGTTIDGTTFAFTPTDDGSYVIRLTVLDDDGGSTTVNSNPIIVSNVDPTASIGGTPVGNINEGTAVNLTATPADDGAEDTFTYAWSVTKDGNAYDLLGATTNTAGFTFTPRDNGAYIATVVVTDDNGGAVTVAAGAITVDNVDPVGAITGTPVGNPDEGDTVALGSTVTDAGADDTHTYAWSVEKDGNPFVLPGGLDTTSSSFAFVPTDNGDYVVTLVVTDDDTGADTVTSATITVDNAAPVGNIQGPATIHEGASPFFVNDITDAGASEALTYAWSVEKDGNAFVLPGGLDTSSSSFSFVPTDNGAYVVTLLVTDKDAATLTRTHNIAVTNVAPTVQQDNAPATGNEGSAITVDSTVSDAGADDTLTYGWTVYRSGNLFALPGGTTTNAASFTFTPTDDGSYVVRLTVLDDDGDSTTVNSDPIIVGNVNPTASISGEPVGNINEGDAVNLTVTPADAGSEDTFSYSWSVTKGGAAYDLGGATTNDANFSFTPRDNGSYIATVVVTDDNSGAVSVSTAAIIADNVDPSPSIIDGPVGNVNEGTTVGVNAFYADPGTDDTATFVWSVEKDGNPFVLPGGTDTTSSHFDFVPTDNGTYVITLTVTDDDGGTNTTTSGNIVVVNVAPTGVVTGDTTTDEGGTVNYSVAVTDPGSADTHTYLWSVEKDGNPFVLPGGVDVASGTFAFVPTDNGAYVVTVVVTDDDAGTNTYTHNLTVENVAPTPSITGAPANSDEGTIVNLGSSISDPSTDDTHSYAWSVTKNGNAYGASGTNSTYAFTPDDNGTFVVTLTTTDDDGEDGTTTASITIDNVASVVTVGGEPVGNINEGDAVNLTTNVTDVGTADTHTYSWTVTRDGQAYVPGVTTTNSTLSFTPTDNGTYVATVVVTDDDGAATSEDSLSIVVDNVDPVGAITGMPVGNIDEGDTVALGSTVTDAGTADTFSYAWSVTKDGNPFVLPGGLDTTSSTFSFVPTDNGAYVITLVVTDDDSGADTITSATITVDNVAPTGVVTGNTTANEGGAVNYSVAVTDPGSADTHTYLWSVEKDGNPFVLPGGVDVASGTFAFVPTDNGAYVVTVVVTDDDAGTNTYTHNLTVANVAPAVQQDNAPATGNEGTAITVDSTVTDAGADDTLTYGWSVYRDGNLFTLPGGTTTNAASFTFTPTDDGNYVVRLTVIDDDAGSTTVNSDPIVVSNVNPTGIISGEPVGSINEGTAVNLTVTPADAGDEDTFVYAWSVTKDGNAFTLPGGTDTESATFSFTPTDNGSYIATVIVTDDDAGFVSVATAAISVDNVDPVGVITGMPVGNIDEGDTVALGSTVTDAGTADTFGYAWSVTKDGNPFVLPGGAVTNANTFNFVPTDNGAYVITLVVTDDDAGTDTITSSTITVDNVAPAPVISGNSSVNEASAITLTVAANDVSSADTHTYSWSVEKDGNPYVLPGGTNTTGSSFTFTPSIHGSYVVSATVTDDDGGSTTATHNVTVNNLPPVVGITGVPAGTRAEGYAFNVAATATDPGGDTTFTYAWSVTKNGSPFTLPGGTVTNAQTFTFETSDNGVYRITTAVTDSGGATGTSTTSNLTITNANPNGTINNAPGTVVENTPITVDVTADDPGSADTLTYLWSVAKNGSSFALPGGTVTNGTSFTFTPNDNGSFVVSVAITDDDGGVTLVSATAITVTNAPPTASISGEPGQSELEGLLIQLLGNANDDSPVDSLTYAWSVTKDGNAFTLPGGTTTNAAAFNFVATDNGTYVATLTVTDDDAGSVTVTSDPIVITNAAPTGTISGPASVVEGATVNATANASDAGAADTHTYAWTVTKDANAYTLPGGTTTNASAFSFVPTDNGAYVLTAVVTDDDAGQVTLTHNLTVTNAAPTATINGVATGVEGTQINLTLTTADAGADDTLTYAWTVTKAGNTITTGTASTLSFTPDDEGTYSISCVVTDDDAGTVTATKSIVVSNVNPVASITGAPVGNVDEGTLIQLGSTASDVGTTDTLSYAWSVTKNGSAFSPANPLVTNQSTFEFTPDDNGSYIATLVVSDNDAGSVSVSTAAITVVNVVPTPIIDSQPASGVEGSALEFEGDRIDPGTADTHVYSWTVTKDGDAYAVANNSAISFSFIPTDNGTYVVRFTTTDDDGGTNFVDSDPIVVSNANPTGLITGAGSVNEGSPITFTANPDDAGSDDTFTYAWTATKDGNAYDLAGLGVGVLDAQTLTFTPNDNGAYVVSVVITDDDGGTVTATKNLTVNNVSPAVTLVGVPSSGDEGTPISVSSNSIDPGNDTLTYGWTIRKDGTPIYPDGVTLSDSTLDFTPADDATYTLRLTVTDEDGGSTTVNSGSIVVANVAPSVDITGAPVNMDEGTTATLGSDVADPAAADLTAGFTYLWTAKLGQTTVATGTEADFDFSPAVHGTYTITLRATDKDGAATTTTATTIEVDNVAPANVTLVGLPSTMTEAEDALLTASSDDAPGDTVTYGWSVRRNGSDFAGFQGEEFVFDPHARGEYEITLTATDSGGLTASETVTIDVENLAPEAAATAPSGELLLGETATFGLSFTDIPPSQQHTVTWNFGDGSSAVVDTFTGNQSGLSKTRTYAAAGTYTVTITIDDGVNSTVIEKTVIVSRAAVRTDPLDSTKTALIVLGTTGNDSILVEPASGKYKVTLNGQVLGSTYDPTGRTAITGGGGNDSIVVTGGLSALVKVGSSGSIVITSAGNDIILGSPQADYLSGGTGRDIVIGGTGRDTLLGGDAEDAIIADAVAWAANNASIKTVSDIWNAPTAAFATRIAAMKASGLFSGANLIADADSDQLYGEAKGDWFFANTAIDRIRDYQAAFDKVN